MRIFSILTAIVVCAVLYLVVFEREALLDFANGRGFGSGEQAPAVKADEPTAEAPAEAQSSSPEDDPRKVSVVAMRSQAREIDSAVVLRGRTEAARAVDVKSETSGLVVSDPLRKGARVEQGDLLCELDPGTREVALAEAEARLAG